MARSPILKGDLDLLIEVEIEGATRPRWFRTVRTKDGEAIRTSDSKNVKVELNVR